MSHHAEGSDTVAPATRVDPARVEPGSETLDTVVKDAAMDQEPQITRKPDDSVAETAATLGTIEQPSRHLVGNAIATLVEALPEEMKVLIVKFARQLLMENSDDQT